VRFFMPVDKGDRYICFCIFLTIFMNAFLAFVNNNVFSINQSAVVLVQLLVTFFAIFTVIRTMNENSILYFNKMVPLFLLVIIAVAMKGEIKYMELYGLFIIPLYVILGINFRGREYSFVNAILMIVFFIAMLEMLFVDFYVDVFNPLNYYTSTRDWAAKVLENKGISSYEVADGDLYSGAYRPGGTISGFSHRVGSIFLEPLTLGYFGFFVFLFLYGLNSYRLKGMYLSALVCVFLAVISDTRIAVFMIFSTVVSLFGVLILSIKAAAAYAFFNGLIYGRLNSKGVSHD
jgi:putative polymerase